MTQQGQRSSKISLVLADVDGSLVTSDKVLTPRTLEAVRALDAAGIIFAITSGRPPRGVRMLIDPLRLTTPIATFNGGMLVAPDMSVIDEHTLASDVSASAVELILSHGLDVWIYCGKDWLVRDDKAPHVAREQKTVKFPPKVVRDFGDALERAVKIVGVSDDHQRIATCQEDARHALGEQASASCSQPYYLDVTHPHANKGKVVETLSRMLSVPATEIATVGDMPNDIAMFRKSGLGVAMGNAACSVRQEAHHVTASNDEDGFAKAMERIVLGQAGKTGQMR